MRRRKQVCKDIDYGFFLLLLYILKNYSIMKNKTRPLILVSNDDGIYAKGVHALTDVMTGLGEVVTVCPAAPQSGKSMAITSDTPLRIIQTDDYNGAKMYKVNGTPVDCVKIAMHTILPRTPDLVVSGINHGSNASVNAVYSGTVGAAFEGCAFGIPSIAFSIADYSPDACFSHCLPFVKAITETVLGKGLPDGMALNVNFPKTLADNACMRVTKGCKGRWTDEYREYTDPNGKKFYWLTGRFVNEEPDNTDTDEWCLANGIVSIVPVALDRTVHLQKDYFYNH